MIRGMSSSRLRKKSGKQIPRGLEAARDSKNKGACDGAPKGAPPSKRILGDFSPQPVQPSPFKAPFISSTNF